MLSEDCIHEAVLLYSDMLFRMCLIMLGSAADAEDIVQETFIAYMKSSPKFNDDDHKRAWLLTVASNKCRNMLRYRKRHPSADLSELDGYTSDPESTHTIELLQELPEKFRTVLALYYIDEYKVNEIAAMIGRSPSAVKMRLQKGRRLLKEKYEKEFGNYE